MPDITAIKHYCTNIGAVLPQAIYDKYARFEEWGSSYSTSAMKHHKLTQPIGTTINCGELYSCLKGWFMTRLRQDLWEFAFNLKPSDHLEGEE